MTPKEQLEGLMDEMLQLAKTLLGGQGTFHPFGGYLKPSGRLVHLGLKLDPGDARKRLEVLYSVLREQRKGVLAFGVASDSWLPSDDGGGRDAVNIFLEHREGYCVDLFFPYELSKDDGLVFAETLAQRGEPVFFVSS